jgi:uncharacterized protein YcbK (DUF882 family)
MPRFFSVRTTVLALCVLATSGARAAAPDAGATPPVAATLVEKPADKPAEKTAKKVDKKSKRPPKNPPVLLYHVNRKDTMTLRFRDAQGQPIKGVQKRFNTFLRCHHTNTRHGINPRLARLIYQTGRHWPGKRIEVVSGYRNPKVAKNPRSPHMKGLACDFRVEGVKTAELRDYLRKTFDKVGVGYYPNSTFVHLDVRKQKSAFWIDYSGPGERAVYAENPNDDLRTGRADQYRPTKIDESWADDTSNPQVHASDTTQTAPQTTTP